MPFCESDNHTATGFAPLTSDDRTVEDGLKCIAHGRVRRANASGEIREAVGSGRNGGTVADPIGPDPAIPLPTDGRGQASRRPLGLPRQALLIIAVFCL